MSTVYKQFFWTIAADVTTQPEYIGSKKRAQLHKAAWDLHSIPSVLHACAGGGTAQEHPEISLTFPVETHSSAEQFTDHIQKALANHDLDVKPSLQGETRFYTLDESDVKRVKASVSFGEDEQETWRLIEAAHSVSIASPGIISPPGVEKLTPTAVHSVGATFMAAGAPISTSYVALDTPAPALSFTITPETYATLKAARGDALRDATRKIYDTIQSLRDETRASAVTLKMALGGLVTLGLVMYEAYATLVSAVIVTGATGAAFGAAALAAAGGPVMIGLAVTAIIAATVGRFVAMKDAVNDLLLTNASRLGLTFNGDHIENGERAYKTDYIPPRMDDKVGNPVAYPCGAYIYRKYQVGFIGPLGFFGSMFGIRFYAERGSLVDGFCIGMECPNTGLGGRNSIYCGTETARVAAGGASARGGDDEEVATTTRGKITGRRADPWGNVNYGFAFFESTA